MQHRRLVRDYETLPQRSAAMVQRAMSNTIMLKLTGESAQSWQRL